MSSKADNAGYRRGVVLGFTVAEVVLLFVFCLLLLLAPTVAVENADSLESPAPTTRLGLRNLFGFPSAETPTADGSARSDQATRAPDARKSSPAADIPPDWKVIVEGGSVYIPANEICVATGLRPEDCTPSKIRDVLRARGEHNWPPIIRLREADGEFFTVGRSEVSEGFGQKIKRDVIPTLVSRLAEFNVDVIEVVGHTDEQPVQGMATNLDAETLNVVRKGAAATRLSAADNAGLGYARAISIVQVLRSDPRLTDVTIIPLSAAQMVDANGKLSDGKSTGDIKERRRIEIRLRRSDTGANAASPK
jgi:hypothetical protein